jgi:hypothetical protein
MVEAMTKKPQSKSRIRALIGIVVLWRCLAMEIRGLLMELTGLLLALAGLVAAVAAILRLWL